MNSCNTAVVDIGGTNIKYGFLPAGAQTPQFTKEAPTNAHLGGTALMETVQALLRALPAFERIGVSTCGQVDRQTGGIRYATDNVPRYTGTPVRSLLEEAFGVPVAVENDVNAAALGEAHFGAGRGCQHFFVPDLWHWNRGRGHSQWRALHRLSRRGRGIRPHRNTCWRAQMHLRRRRLL